MENNKSFQKARKYSFLLLKFRERSQREIIERLRSKKFDAKVITETVFWLKEKNFINDNLFAKSWIESRLEKNFALRKIAQELRLKGIDSKIIEEEINKASIDYSETEEVRKVALKLFNNLKGIEAKKAKGRLFSALIRRGFSPEIITEIIEQI